MKKALHRSLALLLAIVMVCGLLPTSIPLAHAEESTKKISYDMLTATKDKEEMAAGAIAEAPFFSVIGKVTKRTKDDGVTVKAVEVDKACKGAISFTIVNAADVKIQVSSTDSSNISPIAIYNSSDEAMANKEAITEVTGTDKTTLNYTLEAGTYRVLSPENASYGRGARIYSIEVTEKEAVAETKEYNFAASNLTATADKEAVEGNLTEDGYFTASGTVKKRTNSEGGVKTVEVEKESKGKISFKVVGNATMTMEVSSTGDSNTTQFVLVDNNGTTIANKAGTTEVTGGEKGKISVTYSLVYVLK